jgi:hypothetical protein
MERDFDEDMMMAVRKGDANEVAELLAARPELVDARDEVRKSNDSNFSLLFSFLHADQKFLSWLVRMDRRRCI